MTNDKFVDYLVLGGERHGEVWNGLHIKEMLQLPRKIQPLPKFYSPDQEAEMTVPLNDVYFITEYNFKGERYLLATTDPIDNFNVDEEIIKHLPDGLTPLR